MGFVEVLFNLKTILNNIKICKEDITAFQPDAIIFIDYPGFNMRLAAFAKKKRIDQAGKLLSLISSIFSRRTC